MISRINGRHYKTGIKKIRLMRRLISKNKYKTDVITKFKKIEGCHASTAYDWYDIVTTGQARHRERNYLKNTKEKRKLMKSQKLKSNVKCFFCAKKCDCQHHLSYYDEYTINICSYCHAKIHRICQKYHELIIIKDLQLTKIAEEISRLNDFLHKNYNIATINPNNPENSTQLSKKSEKKR